MIFTRPAGFSFFLRDFLTDTTQKYRQDVLYARKEMNPRENPTRYAEQKRGEQRPPTEESLIAHSFRKLFFQKQVGDESRGVTSFNRLPVAD